MKRNSIMIPVLLGSALATSSAYAAITLDASVHSGSTYSANVVTLAGFDATASDKLVVLAGAAHSASSVFPGVGVTGITYNGVAMTKATSGETTNTYGRATGIYFLDKSNFAGAGDIVVTFSESIYLNGFQIGAFALSGTANGFDAAATNNGTGYDGMMATIDVSQAGSFVVAVNSYGNLNAPPSMTELGSTDNLTRAYRADVSVGTYTADFGGGNVTSLASFSPVPEPALTLLTGIGLSALLRRRR